MQGQEKNSPFSPAATTRRPDKKPSQQVGEPPQPARTVPQYSEWSSGPVVQWSSGPPHRIIVVEASRLRYRRGCHGYHPHGRHHLSSRRNGSAVCHHFSYGWLLTPSNDVGLGGTWVDPSTFFSCCGIVKRLHATAGLPQIIRINGAYCTYKK
jgi:hypothetical protein